jgi:hypothetical protein
VRFQENFVSIIRNFKTLLDKKWGLWKYSSIWPEEPVKTLKAIMRPLDSSNWLEQGLRRIYSEIPSDMRSEDIFRNLRWPEDWGNIPKSPVTWGVRIYIPKSPVTWEVRIYIPKSPVTWGVRIIYSEIPSDLRVRIYIPKCPVTWGVRIHIYSEIPNDLRSEDIYSEIPSDLRSEDIYSEISNDLRSEDIYSEIPSDLRREDIHSEIRIYIPNSPVTWGVRIYIPKSPVTWGVRIYSETKWALPTFLAQYLENTPQSLESGMRTYFESELRAEDIFLRPQWELEIYSTAGYKDWGYILKSRRKTEELFQSLKTRTKDVYHIL